MDEATFHRLAASDPQILKPASGDPCWQSAAVDEYVASNPAHTGLEDGRGTVLYLGLVITTTHDRAQPRETKLQPSFSLHILFLAFPRFRFLLVLASVAPARTHVKVEPSQLEAFPIIREANHEANREAPIAGQHLTLPLHFSP